MFFVYISIFVIVTSLIHLAVFESIVSMFGAIGLAFQILEIIFVILALSYFVAALLSAKWNNLAVRAIYKFASLWLGFLIYIGFACVVYALLLVLAVPHADQMGIGLVVLAICTSLYGFIHANRLIVKNIEVELPTLPITWRGRKAVMVSDLHLGQVRGAHFAARVVKKIQELNPEIVFIVGDLFDGVKVDERAVVEPLKALKPPQGVFYVTGNHEEFHDSKHFTDAVEAVGIRVLKNAKVEVNGLQILGVFDKDSLEVLRYGDVLTAMNIEPHRASVLLKHQPTLIPVAEKFGISLQLSGHTHHAQFWPFRFIPRMIYKGFDYGLKKSGKFQVYTGSGTGTWGPPMRVGTDAEITLIAFK